MNIQGKHQYLRLFGLLTVGISSLLYAVAIFVPSSQPPVLLGKYALKSLDLTQGPTKAYRSWFDNGAWQGDIIEYDILQNGTRTTNAPVGSNDPAVLLAAANDATTNWMARAEFLKKETDVANYWKEETSGGRHIITYNGGQVNFLWNNLSATQKLALDATTLADPDGDPTTDDAEDPATDQPDNYFSPILNFIRGDRSVERDKPGGFLRRRYSLLGDITTTPVYIGPPTELYSSFTDYSTFNTNNATRPGRVAAPSNDGMLHILDAVEGTEVFAYVPSMVIPKLDRLAARDSIYEHTYYLDGELTQGSAQRNGTWNTVLTGGGGAGFIGMFAVNLTDSGATGTKIIFEKNESSNSNLFGHIYGEPTIAPLGTIETPAWYVFTGNGYRNLADYPSHTTALLMVSLDTPSVVNAIYTGSSGGLSAPTLLSVDGDLIVDTAFAGDINGDLWMFKINSDGTGTAKLLFDGSPDQPIANKPTVTTDPDDLGSYFVYFGTGSIFSQADAINDTDEQGIYGIRVKKEWIENPDTLTSPITSANLKLQTLAEPPLNDSFTGTTESVRYFSCPDDESDCQAVTYICPDPGGPDADPSCVAYSGWRLTFPDCGERLVGAPFVRAGRVQFVTNNPTGAQDQCGTTTALTGNAWVMSLNYQTGGDGGNVVYNLNGDGFLNDSDRVSGEIPVGLRLGEGNIAQPAFVRLQNGIDKMYINGLILGIPLSPESGPLLGGHIDVETDSPWNGKTAVNNVSKHSEGYNVDVPDGLGRAVDGHVHAYDTIHGVDYVDLFQLEPRRGLANLAASTPSIAPDQVSGTCSQDENQKRILVHTANGDRCIEEVEGELNRAYDTYSKVAPVSGSCPDGSVTVYKSDGTTLDYCIEPPASEVYASDGSTPLSATQKFIVVLTNADLSLAGTLQIGCRTWKVKDYQDWITPELESAVAAGNLDVGDTLPAFFTGNHLVLTLADIFNPNSALNSDITCPTDVQTGTVYTATEAVAKGLSMTPTLRVGFGTTALLSDEHAIVGTRPQCVLGLHDYHDPVCYTDRATLTSAEAAISAFHAGTETPASYNCSNSAVPDPDPEAGAPLSYLRDPALQLHVTKVRSSEGTGFRWRNGALTVQLLAVSSDNKVQFTLQPATNAAGNIDYLPVQHHNYIGGTYAYAYEVTRSGSNYTVHPDNGADPPVDYKGPNESGLLYEASMFWHYSVLADELRTANPANTPCYGDPNWGSRISQENGGLTYGEYQSLTNPLLACDPDNPPEGQQVCPLEAYTAVLVELQNAETEEQRNQALLRLADLLAQNPLLAEYVRYRGYAPGHVPPQHLIPIDQNLYNPDDPNYASDDGTPVEVTTIENIDTETLGPNAKLGRRNWIDLRQ